MIKANKIHWAYVVLAYLTLLSQSILDNARGPAYPNILQSFDISATRGAQLFAWASVAGLIANASARYWLPKIEAVVGTYYALALMALGSFLFGMSHHFGVWMLDFSSVLMGFGMGVANVAMNLLIARATPLEYRRQFYAGLHSVYGLGSLGAPLLYSLFLSFGQEWNYFFCWLIILPMLTLLLALSKRQHLHGHFDDFKMNKKAMTPPVNLITRIAYGCVFGFYVAAEIVVSTRLVHYLSSGHGVSPENARLALSSFFLALLIGRLLFTVVPLRGSSQRWLLLSCAMTLIIYIFSRTISPLFLILTGLTMSYFYPVAMDWMSKKFPQGIEWMMSSVLTSISLLLIAMHLGFGVITDNLGLEAAMLILPIMTTLCFILLLILGKARA